MNPHWFLTLADARKKLEDWRKHYNEDRPHGAIGNKPPFPSCLPWRSQPADLTKPGKLYLPAVQRWGADQKASNSGSKWMNVRGHSSGSKVCLRKATTTASSSVVRIVDLGFLGPVGRSATEARPFHFATVIDSVALRQRPGLA